MMILRYHEIFFRLTAPRCPGMAAGAVSLRKSHDIVILSFCNIVKGQAIYEISNEVGTSKISIAFLIYIINFKVPYNKLKLKFLVQSATFLIFMEVHSLFE